MSDFLARLMRRVIDKSIAFDAAATQVADGVRSGEVSGQDIANWSEATLRGAETNWRAAWPCIRIANIAARKMLDRSDSPGDVENYLKSAADLVAVAAGGLAEVGDVRLYMAAQQAAAAALDHPLAARFTKMPGLIHLRLGGMILDCYARADTPAENNRQFDLWVRAALDQRDPDLLWRSSSRLGLNDRGELTVAESGHGWPEPLAGLDLAERHLRAALPKVSNPRNGRTLPRN